MARPHLDWNTVQELMWTGDDEFERSVGSLDMRGLLDLVTALQNSMAEEQLRFDQLSTQLQRFPDPESPEHKQTSSALCTSQMRLARLCTRNMRCFTQQAIRAKKDQWITTRSSSTDDSSRSSDNHPIVTVHNMSSPSVRNGDDRSGGKNGFRESLRFFQSQTQKVNGSGPNTLRNSSSSLESKNLHPNSIHSSINNNNNSKYNNNIISSSSENKTNFSGDRNVPSVDNILNNVKIICATQNSKNLRETKVTVNASKESVSRLCAKEVEDDDPNKKIQARITPIIFKPLPKEHVEVQSADLSSGRKTIVPHQRSNSHQVPNDRDQEERDHEDEASEKRSDSFESDYDTQDFVVHKANFSEDYLEAMSEDAYSSVNEDYEVEHPEDQQQHRRIQPDIPSPDYESDEEEEYHVHRGVSVSRYDEDGEDFVDNSAQYVADPRRYVYYPDDKELEVIPEEDEDFEEEEEKEDSVDDDSREDSDQDHQQDDLCLPTPTSDEAKLISQAECDSGVTDDQRSSSSMAEECDMEDDTDSAKGSLLLPDSCSESPTHPERTILPLSKKGGLDFLHHLNEDSVEHRLIDSQPNKGNSEVGIRKIAVVTPDLSSMRKLPETFRKVRSYGNDSDRLWNGMENGDVDHMRQPRSSTGCWDPMELLKELYRMDYPEDPQKRSKTGYINKEGYLEKLPSGRRKATYWNPWKRRYFQLQDGFLHCYESQHSEKPSLTLQLMGGNIDTLENNMIGIDDRKGHYVVMRCPNMEEADEWEKALLTHCSSEDFTSTYTQPVRYPLSSHKNVIIIDLGSCSIRAGILMASPTLPQVFFPTVCATDRSSGRQIFGAEALRPEMRKDAFLSFPVLPSAKVTKYTMDVNALPGLLKKVFLELNVDPKQYKIQVSIPRSFSLQTQIKVAKSLLEDFGVKAINLTHQAILSLYAYNASSGIVVDVGDRLDILPITDGYIVEGGVTRLPYGGQRIIHHLKHALAQKHVSLVSDVESYLARHVLEQLCYVAEDYKEECQRYQSDPDSFEMSISTSHFFKGECPWEEIILDNGRFQVPEGLFSPELWGLDNPGIHKLVHRAIQECSVDVRKEMARSIYISGGVTLLPGFVDRLEAELDRLTPTKVTPKVHASPYRYHMSYLGACQLASSDGFEEVCVTRDEWRRHGNACLRKWHI